MIRHGLRKAAPWVVSLVALAGLTVWVETALLAPRRPQFPPAVSAGWGIPGCDLYRTGCSRPALHTRTLGPSQHVAFEPLAAATIGGPNLGGKGAVFTGDLDGAGGVEILCPDQRGRDLLVLDDKGTVVARRQMASGWGLEAVADLDPTPGDEILVAIRQGRRLRVQLFHLARNRLLQVRSVDVAPSGLRRLDPSWQGAASLSACSIADLNGDHHPEFVVGWDSAARRGPKGRAEHLIDRCVAAYDLATGEERWSYALGPRVTSLAVGDIGGDARPEVLVGTNSIANGHESNGTADDFVYVLALTGEGQLLWRTRPLAGYFCGCSVHLAQLQGDVRPEVLVALSSGYPQRDERALLCVLDAKTGAVRQYSDNKFGRGPAVVGDVYGDSRMEVVIGGRDGLIRVFDGKLHLRRSVVARAPTRIWALADVDRDGKAEIVGTTVDARVVVADCSPGYPEPTLSEFQCGQTPTPARLGSVLVSPARSRGLLQVVAWFQTPEATSRALRLLDIHRAELPTATHPTPVTRTGGAVREFAWDRAGERLAFIAGKPGPEGLRVVDRKGALLASLDRHPGLTAPCFGQQGALAAIEVEDGKSELPFGTLLLFDSDQPHRAPTRVRGLTVGPPAWEPKSRQWLCVGHGRGQREWWLVALSHEGEVRRRIPLSNGPYAPRLAAAANPQRVFVLGGRRWRVDPSNQTEESSPRTQLFCLDLETAELDPVTTPERLREALAAGGQGLPAEQVDSWLSTSQTLLPGVAPGAEDEWGRVLPQPLAMSVGGGRLALPVQLSRYVRNPDGTTWVGTAPQDLWFWDLDREHLQRATTGDDTSESRPAWSPRGRWLAYQVKRGDKESSPPEVWLSVPGRLGGARLLPGGSPQWRPRTKAPYELSFLRAGEVWLTQIREPVAPTAPFYQSAVIPYASGGLAGLLMAVSLVRLGVARRTRALFRTVRLFVQAATREQTAVLLREVVGLMDNAENALHSLKNTVMLLPSLSDDEDELEESLSYVLNEENTTAVGRLTAMAVKAADALAEVSDETEALLDSLPPRLSDSLGCALEALLQSRSELDSGRRRLRRLGAQFLRRDQLARAERRDLVQRAHAEVESFYRWLVGDGTGAGLFDLVRHASDPLLVGGVMNDAVDNVAGRMKDLGVSLERVGDQARLRVPGDPRPLCQVLTDLLGNALDAIAERACTEQPGYRGTIRLSLESVLGQTRIAVTDNGCGIASDLLKPLQNGQVASTKGEGRGAGLVAVRRMLKRYPQGDLVIASPGPDRGCEVTVTFEEW